MDNSQSQSVWFNTKLWSIFGKHKYWFWSSFGEIPDLAVIQRFWATMNHLLRKQQCWTRFIYSFNRFDSYFTPTSRLLSSFSGDPEPESWKYMEGMIRCSANYAPLSPISFLERSAKVYRDRTSVVYGSVKYTWSETYQRCLKMASALTQLGISTGDVVSWSSQCLFSSVTFTFAISLYLLAFIFIWHIGRSCLCNLLQDS